jgi:cobalamin biosynthesis Mg chelatase CobN
LLFRNSFKTDDFRHFFSNIPDLWDAQWYQNAEDNDDPKKNTSFVIGSGPFNTSSAAVVTTSSALPSSTSTTSSATSATQSASTTSGASSANKTATAAAQQENKNNHTSFGIRLSVRDTAVTGFALSLAALAIIA